MDIEEIRLECLKLVAGGKTWADPAINPRQLVRDAQELMAFVDGQTAPKLVERN